MKHYTAASLAIFAGLLFCFNERALFSELFLTGSSTQPFSTDVNSGLLNPILTNILNFCNKVNRIQYIFNKIKIMNLFIDLSSYFLISEETLLYFIKIILSLVMSVYPGGTYIPIFKFKFVPISFKYYFIINH